ncbi:MAG: hypothetical protein NVV82_09860 [Sporocytophaga sp.]|nr:hypothetical protein [Sporocytophaga sp.]
MFFNGISSNRRAYNSFSKSETHTDALCNGASSGTATITATGGTSPYTGTGTFSGLAAGTHSFAVTDANGCSSTVSVVIGEPAVLSASETHTDALCNGASSGTATITATGGTSPYTGTGTFSGLAAGTHSFAVTDANGCSSTVSVVIGEPTVLSISETHTDALCNGASSGTATITATGGTSPYTGTGTFTGLSAGTHSFTVTDANGCSSTVSVLIGEPTVLSVSETHTDALCNGASSGTATITATGGTAPYTGTGTFTGFAAGTHSFAVTDANGCSSTVSVVIGEPILLSASETQTDALCNGASSGTATITATGGTAPYTGTGTFTGLTAGTHSFAVTDANGCSSTVSIVIGEPSILSVSETHTDALCNGASSGTATITATGGTAPYTGTGTFSGLAAGTHSFAVTDANGCSSTLSVLIGEPTVLSVSETHTDALCNGASSGTATITATGGTAPYTGTGTFTGLAAGTHSYTVTDANGCSSTVSVVIGEPTVLSISETHTDALCNGASSGTATITATGGTSPYTGTGTFTGLSAGTHSFTVTDANGCSSTVSIVIGEPAVLSVTETHTDALCNGASSGTATITATGGTSPYTGTGTFTGLSAGTHSFAVTDANGCSSTVSIVIGEPAVLSVTETHTDALCNGASSGTATITATGGTSPYTGTGTFTGLSAGTHSFAVTDANGCSSTVSIVIGEPSILSVSETHTDALCNGASSGTATITATGGTAPYTGTGTFTGLAAGTHSFAVTDASGCSSTVSVVIGEPTILSISETHTDALCNGASSGTATITATGGTAPYTGTGTFSGLAAGTHSFAVTDANGCSSTVSVVIGEPTVLSVSETHTDALCNGASRGTATITATGGTAPYTGTGTFTGLAAGTHSFAVTDANGCSSTVSVLIGEPTILSVSETHTDALCNGASSGTATITATGGTAPYTGTGTFTGLSAGTHSFTVTDANGCSSTVSIVIGEPAVLSVTETHTDALCNGASSGTATIIATGGTSPYTGTGTFTGLSAGTHSFAVTDANGCSSTVSIVIGEPAVLSVTETHTDALCNGASSGTATITATGGTSPYTGTGTFTGLSAGTHSFAVTDANGCSSTVSIVIGEPSILSVSETHTDALCNGASSGTATITATGGTAPYTGTGTFTGLAAGTHSFAVTDANGCSSTVSVVIGEPTILSISETHTDALCNGASSGTATITATGGTAPYTGTGTFSGLAAGTHSFAVTDANGCSSTLSVLIGEPTVLSVSETHTDALCNGGSTGTATITATGGTAPYTGTGTFTGLAAGTHSFAVTDANGCSSTVSVLIGEPTVLSVSETHTDALCNGGSTGTATITATGGTAPYTGTGTFTGLAAGTHSFTVTDANGCSLTVSVVIGEPILLSASETHTDALCNGASSGTATITATGGTAPYSGTGTFTGLAAGTHSFTVTDANGCSSTVSVVIGEPTILSISETHTDALCNGASSGTATITATGGTAPYTGTGTFGGLAAGTHSFAVTDANGCSSTVSVVIGEPTVLSASETHTDALCGSSTGTVTIVATGGTAPYTGTGTFTGLAAGTYSYTVTDANNCSASVSVVISQPGALVASETHTDALCNGASSGTATITATGGTSPYTGTGTFTGLSAGTHSFTVTDANGCSSTVSVVIGEPIILSISETHTDALCNGASSGTATITATGGTSPYTGTGTFTGLSAGTHSFTVTDANGCSSTVSVVIGEPIILSISETHTDALCNGASSGTATITATGGTAPYTGTGTFSGLAAGTHSFPVTDANGCSSTVSVVIGEPAILSVSETHTDALCNGSSDGTVTITATGGAAPYTGTGTFTGLVAGTHSFTVTDGNGCSSTVSVVIGEPTILSISETHTDALCNGASTGTATITATGGTAPYTGAGTFTGLAAGTHSYTVTDANGCSSTVSVVIGEPAILSASETHTDALCNGASSGTATITATGGTAPYTGIGTFTGLAAGTHSFTVTDANGCSSTVSVVIGEPAILSVSETHTDALCNGASSGTATITATGGTSPYTGTGTFTGLSAGTHSFTVTDANGCSSTVSVVIGEPAILSASETHTDALCGSATGTVTIVATGGTAPYTGTGTFTGLAAGTYSYTVTDANNCSASVSVVISQPGALVASRNSYGCTLQWWTNRNSNDHSNRRNCSLYRNRNFHWTCSRNTFFCSD